LNEFTEDAVTIPALPCASINDTVAFYVALGFEITYQQTRPNNYACVKHGAIDLHFFSMKGYEPANSYSTCLVMIDDADTVYQGFAAGLRQHYGKLPVVGIPRISRPNNNNAAGDRRFNVIDPGGNYIRFIQRHSANSETEARDSALTKYGRAIRAASLLADAKVDYPAAAKMLDSLPEDSAEASAIERAQALVLRAEIAAHRDDMALARRLLDDLRQLELSTPDRSAISEYLAKADDLAQMLD
jgi:catechol 2,3-dioxygenase-like lactoylglutathione lyase family enzyme